MKIKELVEWLDSMDPETVVVIEGLVYSSNLNSKTGQFHVYNESVDFDIRHSYTEAGKLHIGLEL